VGEDGCRGRVEEEVRSDRGEGGALEGLKVVFW